MHGSVGYLYQANDGPNWSLPYPGWPNGPPCDGFRISCREMPEIVADGVKHVNRIALYNKGLTGSLPGDVSFFRTALGLDDSVCGAVMTIQTFGDYAKWHPHIHSIVADGLFRRSGMFYVMPKLNITPLAELSRSLTSFAYRGQRLVHVERGRPD